jgi:hypothetical protein
MSNSTPFNSPIPGIVRSPVFNSENVKRDGWEHGYTGFPSSSNPYTELDWQYRVWRDAHFEGACAAMDAGDLPPV